MSEKVVRFDSAKRKALFKLRDGDGPSHLWAIATALDGRGFHVLAENIRDRADEWASERLPTPSPQ